MSEYSRRNLACSSHHRCPEGWRSWSGMSGGWTFRPFCEGSAGHAGDHTATIESIASDQPITIVEVDGREHLEPTGGHAYDEMRWPNTLSIPRWLLDTTMHGIAMAREHVYARDQTECEVFDIHADVILDLLARWPTGRLHDDG